VGDVRGASTKKEGQRYYALMSGYGVTSIKEVGLEWKLKAIRRRGYRIQVLGIKEKLEVTSTKEVGPRGYKH